MEQNCSYRFLTFWIYFPRISGARVLPLQAIRLRWRFSAYEFPCSRPGHWLLPDSAQRLVQEQEKHRYFPAGSITSFDFH